ncbi:fungal pheromone STE3G-protein-coupled receptor [Leucogyrophana mollusca]|uniref:Fungal pheromone STE3G-protein-coupled receptor n=1 Tax=Leucogyrophana mollusca TaxID=85980 RepID=A0ACB8BX95_9AGAM|nr:fungal pheromone STE3G-protein-coupled receptor [Leucogyrophana mollusca]
MQVSSNHVFSGLSFTGFFLVALPFSWHFRTWNISTCAFVLWTSLGCLLQFVNSVVWDKNVNNWAPVWCDLCCRFFTAVDVALPATSLCINRRLFLIATQSPSRYKVRKKTLAGPNFNAVVDFSLVLVFPVVTTALQYVVQEYRFIIFEDIGCLPATANVDLAYPLVHVVPVLVGIGSSIYAVLIVTVISRRKQSHQCPQDSEFLTDSWYWRMVCFCVVSSAFSVVPTSISLAMYALEQSPIPWPGWATVHAEESLIVEMVTDVWQSNNRLAVLVQLRRWTLVPLALIAFVFFVSATDTKMDCQRAMRFITRGFGRSTSSAKLDHGGCALLVLKYSRG